MTENNPPRGEQLEVVRAPILVGHRGIVLATLEDAYRFSRYVHASRLAPKALDTPEKILITIQMGMECGIPPMTAMRNCAVINGVPSWYGDIGMALVKRSGLFDEAEYKTWTTGEWPNEDFAWHCQVRRMPDGAPFVSTFSVADAKRAHLWGKTGPWTEYPHRMGMWRAKWWAMREVFPDLLAGFPCTEEQQDIPMRVDAVVTDPAVSRTEALARRVVAAAAPPPDPAAETVDEASPPGNGSTSVIDESSAAAAVSREPTIHEAAIIVLRERFQCTEEIAFAAVNRWTSEKFGKQFAACGPIAVGKVRKAIAAGEITIGEPAESQP